MKKLNKYPEVVMKPGGRVGGTNAPVQVQMTPTNPTKCLNPEIKNLKVK